MAIRYSVQNPSGEDYASPLDQQGFKLQDMMLQHVLGQMNSGNGTGYGGNDQPGGDTLPTTGGAQAGPSLADQLEMRKALMRESVAGDLARGAQTGDYGIRNTQLQQGGATDRARIGIEPAMGQLGLDQQKYGDVEPAVQAQAATTAKLAGLKNGLIDQAGQFISGGGDASAVPYPRMAMMAGVLGLDPQSMMDPMVRARLQAKMDTLKGVVDQDPSQLGAYMSGLDSGDFSGVKPRQHMDVAASNEAQAALQMPDLAGEPDRLANYVDKVHFAWTPADLNVLKDGLTRVQQALDARGVSKPAQQIVLETIRKKIADRIEAQKVDAHGADQARALVGSTPKGSNYGSADMLFGLPASIGG